MTADRASDNGRKRGPTPAEVARGAAAELAELLGRAPEAVVSLARTDDGWRIGLEVLEIRRVPETADVLAEYEVEADAGGRLVGYRRVRRYPRGRVEELR